MADSGHPDCQHLSVPFISSCLGWKRGHPTVKAGWRTPTCHAAAPLIEREVGIVVYALESCVRQGRTANRPSAHPAAAEDDDVGNVLAVEEGTCAGPAE